MIGRNHWNTPEWREAKRVWEQSGSAAERLRAFSDMAQIESDFAKGVRA